ncbi:MAG TPA: CoB--CoM heterodisulfide reductase iron-sulfur subunit A family protein, partial [Deltaproteobacteria bacterium]|nr:CoB--CoM heterodisulfide reductase iron-sulfur subunit A family protein [Deltaproteobacteria bacterium]
FEQKDEVLELEVGAVILALGYRPFDARLKEEYGYGRYKDVLTSLELERMLSASGPTRGEVRRPSDGSPPRKVAWIQCVGSRDTVLGRPYCSSVCCMYAVKEAIILKEHVPGVETAIFFNDVRAFGKGFEGYCEHAKEEGVRFLRGIPSEVKELPEGGLLVRYLGDEGVVEEEFDMVVLSVGLELPEGARELASRLGVELEEIGGLPVTSALAPMATSRPGVYVCGAFQGPKDIPETVMESSGAASEAASWVAEARWTATARQELPPERDVEGEELRIGVIVCHCGINIAGVVDVEAVRDFAKGLPHVVYAEDTLFACSQDAQQRLKEIIVRERLNRVVVASCSPRTHEPLFRQTLREAGLNPYLFEMANIRDQCSWVHMADKEGATEKAKALVRAAVESAALLEPLKRERLPVRKRALVVGGGLAGMTAALGFAEQGFEVFLVERESSLGGNLRQLRWTITGDDPQRLLEDLSEKVMAHPKIQVILNAEVVDHEGVQGNFSTGVMIAPTMTYRKLEHGVTVLATGGEEYKPTEYLYGEHPQVLTQMELEERLAQGEIDPRGLRRVVMIQCVGSRNEERPYCSRICCQMAVKNALKFKEMAPEIEVHVLYRDIRTYGPLEAYYREARERGVIFTRYPEDRPPEVEPSERGLLVKVWDEAFRSQRVLEADLLVLSAAVLPRENEELASMFKVQRTLEGFYLEAHMKLRPVDFSTEGIYMCGLAHGPKLIPETIAQAKAAVARACRILARDEIEVGGVVARVDPELCAACLICVRACPYGVPYICEDGYSVIDPARCRGCGNCASVCPQKAIELGHYRDEQILAKIRALAGGA